MAKKTRRVKTRELNKHQLSRWQAQQKRQRIIFITGITSIALVVIILLSGWYVTQYRPLHVTAIDVNGARFDMQYYIDMVRLQGYATNPEYASYAGQIAVKTIEQDELIRQAASKLGITANEDNVTQAIRTAGGADSAVRREVVRTQLLMDKVKSEYLDKQVPATANQVHILAMLLESEQQATDVRARLEKGENFADLAAQLSSTRVTQDKKGDMGWHPQDVLAQTLNTSVPGDYAFGSEAGVLSQPRQDPDVTKQIGYWIIKVTGRAENGNANVSAMLLGSAQEANQIRTRLLAGDNFTALSNQYNQYTPAKDLGGDMGLLSPKQQTPAFDDYVFNPATKVGELSQPVADTTMQTRGGYWLVKVLEKANDRTIDTADRDLLKTKAVEDWVNGLWSDPANKIDDSYLDSERMTWAIAQATKQ